MDIDKFEVSKGKEVDLIFHEISLMKQLIREHPHPLDLLRELISNSGAKEVGASEIKIRYSVHEDYGHVFEVKDNGCGMNFTGSNRFAGRLDKFLSLGLSAIVGEKSDEFSWKGLGSKLSFQSRRVEIETYDGRDETYRVEINEPWDTIERKLKPKPKIFPSKPTTGQKTGTTIRVYGYPPHRRESPFTVEEITDYLCHRTFVGFTRKRENPPKIILSIFGQTHVIDFGFPEVKNYLAISSEGTVVVKEKRIDKTLSGTSKSIAVSIKGFYTLDEKIFGLKGIHNNAGLILSVKGIPYFRLPLREYGSRQLIINPGEEKCCLIVECDQIQEEMNISRSGLIDSAMTELFKSCVRDLVSQIENSPDHLKFRKVPEGRKQIKTARELEENKRDLESPNQNWVILNIEEQKKSIILSREPANETDVLTILWKLEAFNALPFKKFQTLANFKKGPDLIAHFQEDERGNPERYSTIEIENKFYNYKSHGHIAQQYPKVICWDLGPSPKVRIEPTNKKYKFVVRQNDYLVQIYTIRRMDNIRILTTDQLESEGLEI